ncbi:MAG TPA: hypothetical protein EYN00_04565 [Planctomycetes bacterium]|nr:hypothetical protein [Planctomycetota bacterium]
MPVLFLLLALTASSVTEVDREPTAESIERAIDSGVAYLLDHQEPDGAWGHWRRPLGSDNYSWTTPGTHYSWQVASTGIVCVTLMDLGARIDDRGEAALMRGLDFLCEKGRCKRIDTWDVDNMWGLLYGLEAAGRALAIEDRLGEERARRLRSLAEDVVAMMRYHQSPDGGWAYYDDPPFMRRPSWGTSFVTAAVLLVFEQLEKVGVEVPDIMQERGLRALRTCRIPNGAYSYSVEAFPNPGRLDDIDRVKGSLCRIQVGNLALRICGENEVSDGDLEKGLEQFFRHHKFISLARGRPFPHEAYYANSAYFFFFGHYYAIGNIQQLPAQKRAIWWPQLTAKVLRCQEADGSMWDYSMNSYFRIYGTGWGTSVLIHALREMPQRL